METKGTPRPSIPDRVGPAGWELVDALLDSVLDQPAADRASWLRANAPNMAIANEVTALLAAADRKGVLDLDIPAQLVAPEPVEEVQARLSTALDDRYRIDAVLGQGGAATVFLAHERKHQREVVLKVLRPDVARWIGPERFQSEIRILAQLSHPHILALIDSGNADGLLYYVMPYVGGETLRDRIKRGAVRPEEALPLLRDIAAALAHAHQERLVHRDLKPDNILVVSGHAFLMDFGIAKLRRSVHNTADTTEGFAIGTPRYMAPEQAAGVGVDARADVYAWGIVAAETLLGRVGETRDIAKSVPLSLRRLIDQCLETDANKRPRDGGELLARVDAIAQGGLRENRRPMLLAGLTTAAAAIAVAGFFAFRANRPAAPTIATVAGPVMVAPLTNETGDTSLAVWGRMAGDWLTQGLHQTGRVAVVPWPVALHAYAANRGRGGRDLVHSLAAETDAKTIVTGAYYLSGNAVRFQAQVTDVKQGTVLSTFQAIEVPRDSIRAGIQQLRDRLMAVFAIRTDERLADLPGMVDEPPTYDAYRLFERGIDRFNALDYAPAADAFVEAWRRDTSFTIPLVYAATAYLNQSQDQRADSLVRALRARGETTRLNRYHELTLAYTEATLAGDAQRALEMARQAAAAAPGGRASYIVSQLALSVGRVDEAIAALTGIDPDRGVLRGWAPYWFQLIHAQHLKGDATAEAASVSEVRRRYPDSRAGWVHEVRLLASTGRTSAVDSVMARASGLPPDTYWSQGAMLVIAGEELEAHGHSGAQRYYQRAIDWLANQLARDPSHRAHRYWMGSVYLDRGMPDDAAPYFESLARDYPNDIQSRGLWGLTAALMGDSALARRRLGPAPVYRRGDHLEYLARYAAAAGDRERAIALWSEAVGTGVWGMVWIHASARRDIALIANDPRFQRLGILPGTPRP